MKRLIQTCLLSVCLASLASADVDLVWQLDSGGAVGQPVRLKLFAIADGAPTEPFVQINVILNWDPNVLQLQGVDDTDAPYAWLLSGFPSDVAMDNLNESFDDGDALYVAWRNFLSVPEATPEGLLVTTVEFTALAPASGTEIQMIPVVGQYSQTAVFDDVVPNLNIVGTIDTLSLDIRDCSTDLTGDGVIDLEDLTTLLSAFGTSDGGDVDGDGDTDLADLGRVLSDFGTQCP